MRVGFEIFKILYTLNYGYLQNLDSGHWTGPWTHNYSSSDQFIYYNYNITILPIYTHS